MVVILYIKSIKSEKYIDRIRCNKRTKKEKMGTFLKNIKINFPNFKILKLIFMVNLFYKQKQKLRKRKNKIQCLTKK